MVTSSAVVGSSAMMSLGLQASADGDHHALAHAAGEVVRILLEPALAVGDADQPQQFERAGARLLPRSSSRWMNSGSMICCPIGRTGLSEVIGSWKIIAMSRPRTSRISSSESSSRSRPSNRMRPAVMRAGVLGKQPHDGERGDRLAAAGFADDGDDLAAVDVVGDAVDRANRCRARSRSARGGRCTSSRGALAASCATAIGKVAPELAPTTRWHSLISSSHAIADRPAISHRNRHLARLGR